MERELNNIVCEGSWDEWGTTKISGGLNCELVATVVKAKMLMDHREGGENVLVPTYHSKGETRWEAPALVGRRLFIHYNEWGPGLKGSQRFGRVQQVVASCL